MNTRREGRADEEEERREMNNSKDGRAGEEGRRDELSEGGTELLRCDKNTHTHIHIQTETELSEQSYVHGAVYCF